MFHFATLSSRGIIVGDKGQVSIPTKFRYDYRLCHLEQGNALKLQYLSDRYDYLNEHLFGNRLKKTKLEVTRIGSNLGLYYHHKKIVIAPRMFLTPTDGHLLNTLIHEMCHQYVTEILGDPDKGENKGHGPVWQSTMAAVGLPTEDKFYHHPDELKSKEKRGLEKEKVSVLLNNSSLEYQDRRVVGPTVLRFVDPKKLKDYPVVVYPEWKFGGGANWVRGVKDFTPNLIDPIWFNIEFLVIPGPLKIKTPSYRSAQDYINHTGHLYGN